MIILTIWMVLSSLILIVGIFVDGYLGKDTLTMMEDSLFIAVTWPILLAVAIVYGPFYGIWALGRYLGKKHAASLSR